MADTTDLMICRLENQMADQLCAICSLDTDASLSTSDGDAVSFGDVLNKVLAGETEDTQDASRVDEKITAAEKAGSDSAAWCSGLVAGYGKYLDSAGKTQAAGTAGEKQVSDSMVRFIASREGFSSTPYRGIDSENRTIGYGHVMSAGESYDKITKAQGLALLKKDLKRFTASVNREFSGTSLTQNQFDALVSFSYNLGAYIWDKVPTLTKDVKSGASAETLQKDFACCDRCNGVEIKGLLKRRLDEWAVFVTPDS